MMKKPLVMQLALGFLFPALVWAAAAAAAGTSHSYDQAGRLKKADFGDGRTIAYSYDQSGNLLTKTTTPATSPSPKVKVNLLGGPLKARAGAPLSIRAALDPGAAAGVSATCWLGFYTDLLGPPYEWFTLSAAKGWQVGLFPYREGPLESLSWTEILNLPLPAGKFLFFFLVDRGSDWTFEGWEIVELEVN